MFRGNRHTAKAALSGLGSLGSSSFSLRNYGLGFLLLTQLQEEPDFLALGALVLCFPES